MTAAKTASATGGARKSLGAALGLLRGTGGAVAMSLLAVAALGIAAWLAWRHVGQRVTADDSYLLKAENIEITPPPPWVRGDVKGEAVRDGSLAGLSILDPQVTVRVAQAFATHSWVEKVRRVSKHYPARVLVELDYRQPVAMVEVNLDGQGGLLPVDAEGVVLPPDDFTPADVGRYPRIAVGDSPPLGPVGAKWGDPRVAGAARIASLLEEKWARFRLHRIVAADAGGGRQRGELAYGIATQDGGFIIWGHAPGQEAAGEASASQKVARLTEYLEQNPAAAGPARRIDLRDSRQITVAAGGH